MENLKELVKKQTKFVSGHRACSGCPMPIIAKNVLASINFPFVVANATGCLEVTSTTYPNSAWAVPWIHNTFETAAPTISGVETAYKVFKKKGKINKEIKFIAFGGDGGTFDIGLQALSGALERGHDFLYICYSNEGYCNTGGQRSSATPFGANTTTEPEGKMHHGKEVERKNLMKIVAAHNIKYLAQASAHDWRDLTNKVEKAINTKGPSFIIVLSPCILFWKLYSNQAFEACKKAVDSCFWPLYEIENGKYKLSYMPSKKIPVEEFLKIQGRFKHLFKEENKKMILHIQSQIDKEWDELVKLSKE